MSAPVPDTAPVHTEAVTPDPVTAAVAALVHHDATCGYCADHLPNDLPCQDRLQLVAARRRALRGAPGAGEEVRVERPQAP